MQDANSKIKHLNEVVYSYFSENCGQGENLSNKTFSGKYNDHSAKDLKKILKKLKATQGVNVNEIKYVSCVLRDRLSGKDHSEQDCAGELDHDKHINKSFWGYIKTIMNKKESVLPSFSMSDCASYFMKTLFMMFIFLIILYMYAFKLNFINILQADFVLKSLISVSFAREIRDLLVPQEYQDLPDQWYVFSFNFFFFFFDFFF